MHRPPSSLPDACSPPAHQRRGATWAFAALALLAAAANDGDSAKLARVNLSSHKPLAACKLQSLAKPPTAPTTINPQIVPNQPAAADPLANYERSPLGDWQQPGEVDRDDPWLRFLLLAPRRPIVIDVAVFVDGKPYAEAREAWIDKALKPVVSKSSPKSAPPPAGDVQSPNPKPAPINPSEPTPKQVVASVQSEPKVTTQVRQPPRLRDRLQNYVATAGPHVDRQEIRWLIAEWGFGPAVVVLEVGRSWQRAAVAPLLAYLDSDRDGALSQAEISQVESLMRRADLNADEVIEVSEIRRQSEAPPATRFDMNHPLVVLLDAATDRQALARVVSRVYEVDSQHFGQLMVGPADVTLRVDFGAVAKTPAGIRLLAVGPEFNGAAAAVATSGDVISVELGAEYVEFSAAEGAADDRSATAPQIAVGAVLDGNPLLRLVDHDQDHRLTLREQRELAGLLTALDRDEDGSVAAEEMPTPIRFAVTLGPLVHTLLAQPAAAARKIAPRDMPSAPHWFQSMDKNGDGDLSRGEFLGTTEQFGQIDTDADGLVSVREALKTEAGK